MEKHRFDVKKIINEGKPLGPTRAWFYVVAPTLVKCSQYVDFRDEKGELIGTFTFGSKYQMADVNPGENPAIAQINGDVQTANVSPAS